MGGVEAMRVEALTGEDPSENTRRGETESGIDNGVGRRCLEKSEQQFKKEQNDRAKTHSPPDQAFDDFELASFAEALPFSDRERRGRCS